PSGTMFSPQVTTTPAASTVRLKSRPATMETALASVLPGIRTKPPALCGHGVGEPIAFPKELSPQPATVPSFRNARPCVYPALIAYALFRTSLATVTRPVAKPLPVVTTRPFEAGNDGVPVASPEILFP